VPDEAEGDEKTIDWGAVLDEGFRESGVLKSRTQLTGLPHYDTARNHKTAFFDRGGSNPTQFS
jgi:hypothetical protein